MSFFSPSGVAFIYSVTSKKLESSPSDVEGKCLVIDTTRIPNLDRKHPVVCARKLTICAHESALLVLRKWLRACFLAGTVFCKHAMGSARWVQYQHTYWVSTGFYHQIPKWHYEPKVLSRLRWQTKYGLPRWYQGAGQGKQNWNDISLFI